MWKFYLYKSNPNSKPSIVTSSFIEVHELIAALEKILKRIEEGNASGTPYLRPKNIGDDWKPEKSDNMNFWTHDDVIVLTSGRVRIRALWHYGNFSIYINNPSDPTENYPKFFGPKVSMTPSEVLIFIQNLREIVALCPPYAEMLDFLNQE